MVIYSFLQSKCSLIRGIKYILGHAGYTLHRGYNLLFRQDISRY